MFPRRQEAEEGRALGFGGMNAAASPQYGATSVGNSSQIVKLVIFLN